jgi:hypothetical protein
MSLNLIITVIIFIVSQAVVVTVAMFRAESHKRADFEMRIREIVALEMKVAMAEGMRDIYKRLDRLEYRMRQCQ